MDQWTPPKHFTANGGLGSPPAFVLGSSCSAAAPRILRPRLTAPESRPCQRNVWMEPTRDLSPQTSQRAGPRRDRRAAGDGDAPGAGRPAPRGRRAGSDRGPGRDRDRLWPDVHRPRTVRHHVARSPRQPACGGDGRRGPRRSRRRRRYRRDLPGGHDRRAGVPARKASSHQPKRTETSLLSTQKRPAIRRAVSFLRAPCVPKLSGGYASSATVDCAQRSAWR